MEQIKNSKKFEKQDNPFGSKFSELDNYIENQSDSFNRLQDLMLRMQNLTMLNLDTLKILEETPQLERLKGPKNC